MSYRGGGRRSSGPRRSFNKRRSFGFRGPKRATRRSKRNPNRARNVALGIGAGLLAINAGILGAASTSRAIRELGGAAKAGISFLRSNKARKIALKTSTEALHNARVSAIRFRGKKSKSAMKRVRKLYRVVRRKK